MAEVASVEAAPIAGATSIVTPAADSQTALNAPPEKAAMALSYEEKVRNALSGNTQSTEPAPVEAPAVVEDPAQVQAPTTEEATRSAEEAKVEVVDEADVSPEDYGPEDVKAALKRIHPDARKVLHNAFYRSEEIKKLGYKVDDLRLWHNAGLTSERMLATLQRFPLPEHEEQALVDASNWQQFFDDYRNDAPKALVNLARTDPDAFARFATEAARAAEVINPQAVTQRDMAKARGWISTLKERGKKLGDENMIAAAEIIEKDMGFDTTAKEPEIPEEYRRRMSELEKREQDARQREQQNNAQRLSGFQGTVYNAVRDTLVQEATKHLGTNLTEDQKSWVLSRALAGVEADITGNQVLMRNINRMIETGPLDQNHFNYVVKQIADPGRRLVVTNLSKQLNELKKLSTLAPPVRTTSPAQATVSARTDRKSVV